MDLLRIVTVIRLASLLFPLAVSLPMCKITEYYDSVTRSCAHCSDICINAVIQRTESACQEKCGGWPFPPNPPEGEQAVEEKDHKGVIIGTVVPACVLAIVTLFVTVKYRQQITIRVQRICRPDERNNADDIEMHPMRRNNAGDIENRPDRGRQEEGRREDGHRDKLEPEPAMREQETCPDGNGDQHASGDRNFISRGSRNVNTEDNTRGHNNTSGGDDNTRRFGNTASGGNEIEERQALLSSENTGRKEVSPESGVQAVQDAVDTNPVFSPSVQGFKI